MYACMWIGRPWHIEKMTRNARDHLLTALFNSCLAVASAFDHLYLYFLLVVVVTVIWMILEEEEEDDDDDGDEDEDDGMRMGMAV